MPRRVEDFRGLTQSSRLKLLHAVQKLPGRRLQELADEVNLHVNTAREHLQVLEDEGLIASRPADTGVRGRPPMVFDPVKHAAENESADRYAMRAQEQGDLLRRIEPDLDLRETLGTEAQHQIDVLYSHLEDAGFDPVQGEDGVSFDLHPCVYHGLIKEQGTLVCAVHANLVRDQLEQVQGPMKLDKLQPFVTPHLCKLKLATRQRAAAPGGGDAAPGGEDRAGRADPAIES